MSEITLELHLIFQIPESGLTINRLIGGLKEAESHPVCFAFAQSRAIIQSDIMTMRIVSSE